MFRRPFKHYLKLIIELLKTIKLLAEIVVIIIE